MGIRKFSFGKVIDCNSVIIDIKEDNGNMPYFKFSDSKLKYALESEDLVYGLGENVRGINKRGWIYESYCSDDPNHAQDKRSLYGAHNFLIVHGENKSFGVFINTPSKVSFDVGYSNNREMTIEVQSNDYDVYIIEENNVNDISKSFRQLIGMTYVPPKWAFGYQQSRWSYNDEKEVREIGQTFRDKEIPLDCVYLDIDYMERFKNFTINKESFKTFDKMVKDMKNDGIRLIPIIDAGVKIEDGYDIYEEGIEKGYFCKDKDGNPFVAAVWPGKVHFPDFLNKDARLWFGKKYKWLVDKGIDGFWNDMNEPAIFYSEEGLKKAFNKVEESKGKNLDIYSFFELKDTFNGLSNSSEDYNSFYHNMDGEIIKHNDVHNLYGHNMTRSAAEGLESIDSNKRFLLFSRASSIGMHRYGGIWTGDNTSLWEHLEMNIKMMPNLNMCGYLYTGADTGGFGGNCTEDLMMRWCEFSMFTPLFRNHSAMGTRRQEPFAFDVETEKALKKIIQFRYALIPYLYSEYMKSAINNENMFRPLSFEYNDKDSRQVEDQLLLGDSLMLAPIFKQNAKGRYVYLPEDMMKVQGTSLEDITYEVIKKGHHYINAEINEIMFFIRKDKMIVLGDYAKNVESINNEQLKVIAFVDNKAKYSLYDDDGISKEYIQGSFNNINIEIENNNNGLNVICNKKGVFNTKKINIIAVKGNGEVIKKDYNL